MLEIETVKYRVIDELGEIILFGEWISRYKKLTDRQLENIKKESSEEIRQKYLANFPYKVFYGRIDGVFTTTYKILGQNKIQ